jgi:AmmeMemoRadiSam system protein A
MKDQWKSMYGKKLVQLARAVISRKLKLPGASEIEPDLSDIPSDLLGEKRGVFVTLQKNGRLRGCIGTIEPVKTVLNGVEENALHAAFNDARFEPVTPEELADIDVEVSLLTVPEKLRDSHPEELLKQITPFEDGVIVQKGHQRATFLPQVWEQLPEPEAFLTQLCQKARLDAHSWQTGDLTVFTYQVASFKETRDSHGH